LVVPQAPGTCAAAVALHAARRAAPTPLSEREREVLSYLPLGYTNRQIAQALGSATRTVRNQLSRAYEKLGVGSRAEAVAVWHGTDVPWIERPR